MKTYDFILVGGGVSGLSLAYHLAKSPLGNASILIIDSETQTRQHALSFWSDHSSPFDPILSHSWNQLQIQTEGSHLTIDLGTYRYNTLRVGDFADFIHQELSGHPAIEFMQATVDQIEDFDHFARVSGKNWEVSGKWVFDSRFQLTEFSPRPGRFVSLRQHFRGWEIETGEPVFDPQIATLFDFRVPQNHELRFFYILPFTPQHALVEYVLLSPENQDEAIRSYIENTLGIHDYRVLSKEGGVTPLSDSPFPRKAGRHILNVGIRGGRVKPSSGYSFTRIQKDSAAIVQSLMKNGHPFEISPDPGFYRFCDSTLLQIMNKRGETVKPIYLALFKKNPAERVFRFLDETHSQGGNLALLLSLPLRYFWRGLFREAFLHLGFYRRK
jgi:lycopene beta-cyclase